MAASGSLSGGGSGRLESMSRRSPFLSHHHHPHHPTAGIEMSSAAELPSKPERCSGCRGGWRRLRRAAAAARSPERRRRRCGAAAGERRGGDADVATATCRSSRARPSSPYPAACTSHRHRCGLLRLRGGEAQLGRRRRPQAISYAVRSGRLDGHALLLLLAADIIPHGERHYGHAVWRRAPSRVPAGRGGDGVGAPGPRLAGKVLAIQLGSLGADQRSGDEADGRGQRGEPVSPLLVGLPLDVSTHMQMPPNTRVVTSLSAGSARRPRPSAAAPPPPPAPLLPPSTPPPPQVQKKPPPDAAIFEGMPTRVAVARRRRPLHVRGRGGRTAEAGASWPAERAWSTVEDSAVAGPRVARTRPF
ncbi:hypothetical protein [Oryza sativa Japonica Group]|uniref:Uncharacterized protein n=1 Tax=Oryza sativa subsp. japonica TaxID=39947 RepID=Q5JNT3_ORYSJ|nr:hypothetical protein [Oryza sativa Japonica Group]